MENENSKSIFDPPKPDAYELYLKAQIDSKEIAKIEIQAELSQLTNDLVVYTNFKKAGRI